MLITVKFESVRVAHLRTGLNAEQRVVGNSVVLVCVVEVVCCEEWCV